MRQNVTLCSRHCRGKSVTQDSVNYSTEWEWITVRWTFTITGLVNCDAPIQLRTMHGLDDLSMLRWRQISAKRLLTAIRKWHACRLLGKHGSPVKHRPTDCLSSCHIIFPKKFLSSTPSRKMSFLAHNKTAAMQQLCMASCSHGCDSVTHTAENCSEKDKVLRLKKPLKTPKIQI